MPLYTLSDLITAPKLQEVLDHVSSMAKRIDPVFGAGAEPRRAILNGAITAASTTGTFVAPAVGSWADYLPRIGTLLIENEIIDYANPLVNQVTFINRGANNTVAAAHVSGSVSHLPASVSSLGEAIKIVIVGDALTEYGVGSQRSQVILDLLSSFRTQYGDLTSGALHRVITDDYISALETHIGQAGQALTGVPSYAVEGYRVTSLMDYLRYLNDPVTGARRTILVPENIALSYWYFGGAYLHPFSVFPDPYTLWTTTILSAGPTISNATGGLKRRYNDALDPYAFYQGFNGQPIQARVVASGSGSCNISVLAEGITQLETYFGRTVSGGAEGLTADPSPGKRTFSGSLNMGAIGNVIPLLNGVTDDLPIKLDAPNVTGTITGGSFVIETIPTRRIP